MFKSKIKKWNALDASHSEKFALENETHQFASNHRKLQPILEPGNHENWHDMLRVFVHFVIPYVRSNVTKPSHLYHTPACQVLLAAKEDIPPCLPEVLRRRGFLRGRCFLSWRLFAANDNNGVFARAHVAQLLARLFFDN